MKETQVSFLLVSPHPTLVLSEPGAHCPWLGAVWGSFWATSYSKPATRMRKRSWLMDFFRDLMYVFTCFSIRCRKQLRLQLPGQERTTTAEITVTVHGRKVSTVPRNRTLNRNWDGWPVVSPGLTSASSSKVMRVTSLFEGLRVCRPLAFLDESHVRLTNVTWQLLHIWPPPADKHKLWSCSVHQIINLLCIPHAFNEIRATWWKRLLAPFLHSQKILGLKLCGVEVAWSLLVQINSHSSKICMLG